MLKRVDAGVLSVAFEESGDADGTPVVLLHGFPYDVRAFDAVMPVLTLAGCRVITPYLRGYGPTRFLSERTMRSGQQAVLAHDLLALLDALAIPRAVLPDGHFNFLHLWPGQIPPPPKRQVRLSIYSEASALASRAAASLRR